MIKCNKSMWNKKNLPSSINIYKRNLFCNCDIIQSFSIVIWGGFAESYFNTCWERDSRAASKHINLHGGSREGLGGKSACTFLGEVIESQDSYLKQHWMANLQRNSLSETSKLIYKEMSHFKPCCWAGVFFGCYFILIR